MFEIGTGLSRNWSAFEAGEELTVNALRDLKHTPKFFILFSTIHPEKHGGFRQLLRGVYSHLPKNVPLVGGTVAGFVTKTGCYTRGAVGVAFYYDDMDIATSVGQNTKKNPKKAGEDCAKKIKSQLLNERHKNKILFNMISGPILPVPMRILPLGKLSSIAIPLTEAVTLIFQKCFGRESEVLGAIRKVLPDYFVIGGSTIDDAQYTRHFQFYNNQVLNNSIVALGISTNLKTSLKSVTAFRKTSDNFRINKKAAWNYVIEDINGKPAKSEFVRLVKWNQQNIDENVHKRTPYFPVGAIHPDGTLHVYPIALFLGDYLALGHDLVSNEIFLTSTSGKELLESTKTAISEVPPNSFSLIVSCAARLETIGSGVYKEKEILDKMPGDYIMIFTLGENRGEPNKNVHCLQETLNILTLSA